MKKELQKLESHLEEVRNSTVKEAEYQNQMTELTTQMQEMCRKFNLLATEMRSDKMDLTSQIRSLLEIVKLQTQGNTSSPNNCLCDSISSTNVYVTPPKTTNSHIQFGVNLSPKTTTTPMPLFMSTGPIYTQTQPINLVPNPPTLFLFTQPQYATIQTQPQHT